MGAKRIDPERAKELLEKGQYTYLDVRTPEEFAEGHVPDAHNIPYMIRGPGGIGIGKNDAFLDSVANAFARDTRLILGCQKGGRAVRAAGLLAEQGFSRILEMRGGFIGETDPFGNVTFPGWCAKGYPTSKE